MAKMEKSEVLVEVYRDNEYLLVPPEMLTRWELCSKLDDIILDSDDMISDSEISEWYAVIGEAVRRLSDAKTIADAIEEEEGCRMGKTFHLRNPNTDEIEEFNVGDIIIQVYGEKKFRVAGIAPLGIWIQDGDIQRFLSADKLDKEWIVVQKSCR